MTVVGILVCDHFPTETRQAAGGDVGDLYVALLETADPGIEPKLFHPIDGQLPRSDECDAWMLTGSRHDAHGEERWIVELRDWIVDAVEAGDRIVGVCFGHQIVAHALGGRSERADAWKVGPMPMSIQPTPWFEGGTVTINAMHRDEVTALPPGATAIGTGPSARYPAYVIAEQVLCVQDHPEFTNEFTGQLIERRVEAIGADVAGEGLARVASTPTDGPRVGAWLAAFLADARP